MNEPTYKRPTWCGGAVLRIDEGTYRQMEREGVRWETRSEAFRHAAETGGKIDARMSCDAQAAPGLVLCLECAGREANWRRVLRDLAETAKVEPR